MRLTFLGPLYARPGPYACAYLDTSRDLDHPDEAITLRRRHVAADLADQGADPATTGAVADVVGTDRDVPGRHGQAIFAAHGRLALAEELPDPPARDTARFTMVPDAMPLALQHAPDIAYAAVLVHRVGDDTPGPGGELEVDVQTGRWPVARVAPGEHTRRRVPAGEWRQAAAEIAERLTALADGDEAEVIVLSGDHRARNVVARDLPRRLRERVIGIDSDRRGDPERALLEEELGYLFHGRLSARDRARTDRFLARRARGAGAAEGLPETVTALRHGRAEAVLLTVPHELGHRTLWVGLAPRHVAVSADELRAEGVAASWEEPADAALIRAIVGTGAELVVLPREELPLNDGLGVLLRYGSAAAPGT